MVVASVATIGAISAASGIVVGSTCTVTCVGPRMLSTTAPPRSPSSRPTASSTAAVERRRGAVVPSPALLRTMRRTPEPGAECGDRHPLMLAAVDHVGRQHTDEHDGDPDRGDRRRLHAVHEPSTGDDRAGAGGGHPPYTPPVAAGIVVVSLTSAMTRRYETRSGHVIGPWSGPHLHPRLEASSENDADGARTARSANARAGEDLGNGTWATRSDRCCSELSRWSGANGGPWRYGRTWAGQVTSRAPASPSSARDRSPRGHSARSSRRS